MICNPGSLTLVSEDGLRTTILTGTHVIEPPRWEIKERPLRGMFKRWRSPQYFVHSEFVSMGPYRTREDAACAVARMNAYCGR